MATGREEIWDYTTFVDLQKKGKGDAEQKTREFSRLGDKTTKESIEDKRGDNLQVLKKPSEKEKTTPKDKSSVKPLTTGLKPANKTKLKETPAKRATTIPSSKPKPKPFNPAIEDEEEKKEFFDSAEDLDKKVKQIAGYVKSSRFTLMFTGAGISTSTGIPDFRSGMNTVLSTGPGKFELKDKKDKLSAEKQADLKKKKVTQVIRALPSLTHMSIMKMHQEGLVALTVSQNVDGLHRRSNINPTVLAELHGNTNLERCKKCGHEYMRDYRTRTANHVKSHVTGRKCDNPKCRGDLLDSIVNFGENLPEHEMTKAFNGAEKADLCIVLGSSLRVTPASEVPCMVKIRGGKVVICNLQRTLLHRIADVNVHALCDNFMGKLMAELGLDIPAFKLHRKVKISVTDSRGNMEMSISGVDPYDNSPYSFITGIVASCEPRGKVFESKREPFAFELPKGNSSVKLQIHFQGHYNEPCLHLDVPRKAGSVLYNLRYQPGTDMWECDIVPE